MEEFLYLVFTRMPGERYHRRFRSLSLSSCMCWFYTTAQGLVLFQIMILTAEISTPEHAVADEDLIMNNTRLSRGGKLTYNQVPVN